MRTGNLAVKLASRGYTVTGVDLSDIAIQKAKEQASKAGVSENTNFLVLDINDPAQNSELADIKYNLITCKLVMAFIPDKADVLAWVHDHLKPQGAFILITPVLVAGQYADDRLRRIAIEEKELLHLLQHHFDRVTEVHTEFFDEWGEERTYLLST